jgi:2-haloacid dehalogenase
MLSAPNMTYSWLLFDADGTLFDYDQAEATALQQAFAEVGTTFEPAHLNAYREINTRVWREFEAGRITAERLRLQRFELLFETLGRSLTPAEFSPVYLRHLARASQLIEGAREIVPALCAKYRLALITNGLRDVQRPRLAGSAIRDCFKEVIISEEIGAAKPDPAIFDAAFERLGRPQRAEVLLVGDSLTSDIAGGRRYGLDTCWFNPTGAARAADATSTYEIRHLSELARLLL